MLRHLACLLLAAGAVLAGDAWYLPYEPDAETLVLSHGGTGEVLGSAHGKLNLGPGASLGPGRFGEGLVLPGQAQQATIAADQSIRFGRLEPFTVELWVKPTGRPDGGLWSLGTRWYLHVGRFGQFGYRAASFPIRYNPLGTALDLPPNTWSHVALTHDADRRVVVYVNGEQVAELTHADEGDYEKGGPQLNLGSHDGWTMFGAMTVDEIRISRGVRQYAPLLEQRFLIPGESLKLGMPAADLPPSVATVRVRLTRGNRDVVSRDIDRADLDAGLLPADAWPTGRLTAELTFLDAAGAALSSISTEVRNAGPDLDAFRSRRDAAAGELADNLPWSESGTAYLDRIDGLLAARRVDELDGWLDAAERVGRLQSTGEAAWRQTLRRWVRAQPVPARMRITMSWDREPADALAWADRLGANEIVGHGVGREAYQAFKQAGFTTVKLEGVPIHDAGWLKDHPELRQRGYARSKPVTAGGGTATISLNPPTWSRYELDREDAARWWRVVDDQGTAVPPARWAVDEKLPQLTVHGATPGRSYTAYFCYRAIEFLDPLAPGALERGTAHLAETVEPLRDVLDTFWFDDLSYGYPGPNEQTAWDWESYTQAASPTTIAAFEQATGIPFDPAWLVPEQRTIDSVPDPRYLQWMTFVQQQLQPWIAAHAEVLRQRGTDSWLYWGDCHVGMEPYLGSLAAIDAVDKPAADPVTVRALTDFPGNTYRRMRTDWLFPNSGTEPAMGARHWRKWQQARRALLRQPKVHGLYWMVLDTLVGSPEDAVREDMTETLASIDDEFRLIDTLVGDRSPFCHDLDVVVLNAWGEVYSWRPWGSTSLWPLADLPVNVTFRSYQSVVQHGLPEGTDVVYCYGLPETAWSGGAYWRDGRVLAALQAFVEGGGGLVAMQAPGQVGGEWPLGDWLGLEATGSETSPASTIQPAELMDVARDEAAVPTGAAYLAATRAGADHPVLEKVPSRITGWSSPWMVNAGEGVLAAWDDGQGHLSPGLVTRHIGRGRVVWLAGLARNDGFDRLIRNAIFWSADRTEDARRLAVDGDGLAVFAYPREKLLAIDNANEQAATAAVRCDPAIFGATGEVRLTDVVTGDELGRYDAARLVTGVEVEVPAAAIRFCRVGF